VKNLVNETVVTFFVSRNELKCKFSSNITTAFLKEDDLYTMFRLTSYKYYLLCKAGSKTGICILFSMIQPLFKHNSFNKYRLYS